MISVEIISTGTEILRGRSTDTNFIYIAKRLFEIGLEARYHTTLADNMDDLCQGIDYSLKRAQIVLMTGGLGPTKDDFTRQAVAKIVKKKLVYDKLVEARLRKRFSQRRLKFTPNIKTQCFFPEGSVKIKNTTGTADGFHSQYNSKHIFTLSGVPSEMQQMFEDYCVPFLRKFSDKHLVATWKIFGMPEAHVDERVVKIIKNKKLVYGITSKHSIVTVTLRGKPINFNDQFKKAFGRSIFSTSHEELNQVTARLLLEKNVKLSIAESFTGGRISDYLTNYPGISTSLIESRVVYSNDSKINMGVSADTIKRFGAVSEETCGQMSQAILSSSRSDVSLATTGIAGPTGSTKAKPIGLCFISISSPKKTVTHKFQFSGTREDIKEKGTLYSINLLRLFLEENFFN